MNKIRLNEQGDLVLIDDAAIHIMKGVDLITFDKEKIIIYTEENSKFQMPYCYKTRAKLEAIYGGEESID